MRHLRYALKETNFQSENILVISTRYFQNFSVTSKNNHSSHYFPTWKMINKRQNTLALKKKQTIHSSDIYTKQTLYVDTTTKSKYLDDIDWV